MTTFHLTLSSGALDIFKKALATCARHSSTLFIEKSKVSQQIHQNMWLRSDFTSILGEDVNMSLLLDNKSMKQLKHVKCENTDVVVTFDKDRYRVTDGQAAANVVYLPPISLTHTSPPTIHQLSAMGTTTPLYEDALNKVLAVCRDNGPIVLFFDNKDEMYAIANKHHTTFHLMSSEVLVGSMDAVKPNCVLLSYALDKVECAGLELSAFKESFSSDSIHGRFTYWLLVKMDIALGVSIELLEQVQPLSKVIQDNYLRACV